MTATANGSVDPVGMVDADRAIAEIRAALEMLDAVIQVRLEERKGGPQHRPLSVEGGDEGIPPLERYDGAGPLAAAIGMADLTAPEALVLVAAIAPHVDERFNAAYGSLTDRDGVKGLTGEVARTLMARSFAGRLDATAMLGEHGALRASGLVSADSMAGWQAHSRPTPDWLRGYWACRPERPHATADFPARPLATVHTLADVVLPARARARLADLERRIEHRDTVAVQWGFARHHDNASGLVALFHGPPGTGKTMTAAAVAASAGLPAYVIDLSALVSKYIGETEKALSKVFERAERERCVLVFDEADAVFGSRTEVTDSHDRYANQEVSYLLARIESHPGVVILTTNLLGNIDTAFLRRIHVIVEFPTPGAVEREVLWQRVLPRDVPTSGDLGLAQLAERYRGHRCGDSRRGDRGGLPRRGQRRRRHQRAARGGNPASVRQGGQDGSRVTATATAAGRRSQASRERGAAATRAPDGTRGPFRARCRDSTVVPLTGVIAGGLEAVQAEWGLEGGDVVLTGRRPFLDVTGRAGFRPDGTLSGAVQMRAALKMLGLPLGEASWTVAGWTPDVPLDRARRAPARNNAARRPCWPASRGGVHRGASLVAAHGRHRDHRSTFPRTRCPRASR